MNGDEYETVEDEIRDILDDIIADATAAKQQGNVRMMNRYILSIKGSAETIRELANKVEA